jgi:hypothetical protein
MGGKINDKAVSTRSILVGDLLSYSLYSYHNGRFLIPVSFIARASRTTPTSVLTGTLDERLPPAPEATRLASGWFVRSMGRQQSG